MATGTGDARKARYWQQTLGEAERVVDLTVLPSTAAEGESVLLVAASASHGPAGRGNTEAGSEGGSGELRPRQRGRRRGRWDRVGIGRRAAAADYEGRG